MGSALREDFGTAFKTALVEAFGAEFGTAFVTILVEDLGAALEEALG